MLQFQLMPYKDSIKQKQAQHESYLRNKDKIIQRHRDRKASIRALVSSVKERTPCVDCGRQYTTRVMHYHHLTSSTKIDTVSNLVRESRSLSSILAEIEKCELLCANCHALRHNGGIKHETRRKRHIRLLKEASACNDCQTYYPARVMHYHHLDPALKTTEIATLLRRPGCSLDEALLEIEKCVLLCANCHAIRHTT